ncbi:MAG: hypothetical protein R3B68_11050 [Phycisphaerales bacterium]
MSRFLQFECEPLAQPAATDPLEKASWSSLRIRAGGQAVSRVFDRKLGEERSLLYVPVFSVAEWIANNWWTILHEPCRTALIPDADADEPHFSWTQRHCLRSAESDLLLPALYLYSEGHRLRAEWQADDQADLPHMPAYFVGSGSMSVEREATEQVFAEFVSEVISRASHVDDSRVCDLRELWQAIRDSDDSERTFCVIAGRLGRNPYDSQDVSDALAKVIESLGDEADPLVEDVTSATAPDNLASHWDWTQRARSAHGLQGLAPLPLVPNDMFDSAPAQFGYRLSHVFRDRAGLGKDAPLSSIDEAGTKALGRTVKRVEENHLPGKEIRLIVGGGRDSNGPALIVGPRNSWEEGERFQMARGLFLIASAASNGPRLVTEAFTWNQKASRAFAAELLAPRVALKNRVGDTADRESIRDLADEFRTSTMLIENQLRNARVNVLFD